MLLITSNVSTLALGPIRAFKARATVPKTP